MNPTGIDKKVEIDRKENLRKHRLYWIGRRTQDVILSWSSTATTKSSVCM